MTAISGTTASPGPWSPLRVRVFRGLWLASVVSNVGSTMHTVGASWAMTGLSSSPAVVSLVQTAWAVPGFLVAVPAGAFADVVDRRRVIIVGQIASLLFAATLGVLQVSGALDVPLLLLGTFVLSIAMTLSSPALMALIPDLVGPDELTQAIGLNNIAYSGSQSVGPALAGVVIAVSGPGAVFLLNAVSFLGIVAVAWRYRPERPGPTSGESLGEAMRSGVRYFSTDPRLRVYALRIAAAFFVTSSVVALLPVLARNRLDTSAFEFGVLAAALGVGAIAAVWVLPRVRVFLSPDAVILAAGLLWAAAAAVLAITGSIAVAALAVLVAGSASMATMNITYSMFMLLLPVWIRGRASSVVMLMVWLGTSVGTVAWGTFAARSGLTTALLAAGAAQVIVTVTITSWFRLGDIGPLDGSGDTTDTVAG